MEDVASQSTCIHRQVVLIIIILLVLSSHSFAAKQGTVGATSSGSINISVTIPDKVELFVDQGLAGNDDNTCLRVLDYMSSPGLRRYKIRMFDTRSMIQYVEPLMLHNVYGPSDNGQADCNAMEVSTLQKVKRQAVKGLVLMLVPE